MPQVSVNVTVETNLQCSVDLSSRQPRVPCPHLLELDISGVSMVFSCSHACHEHVPGPRFRGCCLVFPGNFEDVLFYPTRFFRQFWANPFFQLFEALYWPKRGPKS